MKKSNFLVLITLCSLLIAHRSLLFAQVPQAINYQAVARDKTGQILIDYPVKVRISVLQGTIEGTAVYIEEHNLTTTKIGVLNIEIGNGVPSLSTFSAIEWGNNKYYLKIELDATGSGYVFSGVSQLLSVPYALYAEKANCPQRMTEQERNAIKNPYNGMEIFNTTTSCLNFYKNTTWFELCGNTTIDALPASNSPRCSGDTLKLTASTLSGVTYYWTGPNGFTSTLQNPVINNVTTAAAGDYSLKTSICNNSSTAVTTVIVYPRIQVSLTIQTDNTTICAGSSITFTTSASNGGTTPKYQWRKNGINIYSAYQSTFSSNTLTDKDLVSCVLTASEKCASPATSNTIEMKVITTVAVAGPNQKDIQGTSTTLAANTPIGGNGLWTIQSGTGGNIQSPTSPTSTFTGIPILPYVLRWTISSTCGSSYSDVSVHFKAPPCEGLPSFSYGGQTYNTVQIGTQCWMKENLNIGTRIDGASEQTNNSTIEKYCYNNDENNCNVYGGLYQWDEMMQYVTTEKTQGICPSGWHIPNDDEWSTTITFLGGPSIAGGKMKETGTTHWASGNAGGTNESGLTELPGGRYIGGSFSNQTKYAYFWSSNYVYSFALADYSPNFFGDTFNKTYGLSMRCIKD